MSAMKTKNPLSGKNDYEMDICAAQGNEEWKIEIGGHTDYTGSDAYNQTLSQKRASAVRAYLISQGISAERLTAKGYGEAKPIASNETEEGKAENRRVEFKIQ